MTEEEELFELPSKPLTPEAQKIVDEVWECWKDMIPIWKERAAARAAAAAAAKDKPKNRRKKKEEPDSEAAETGGAP